MMLVLASKHKLFVVYICMSCVYMYMCMYSVHVCVCVLYILCSCYLLHVFYTLLGTTPQSREQKRIPTSPNAAYEDINKFDTNINPAYGEMRETRQQHVTYEEISMQ